VRFASNLGLGVLVADADVPGFDDNSVLQHLPELSRGGEQVLVLLGRRPEVEAELPRAVRYIQVDGLAPTELVRRLRMVLLGQEVGVETDPRLEALVGELEQAPPLELVRALHQAMFTGQVELPSGEIRFHRGEVVAATARPLGSSYRPVGGLKAFCRLGRLRQGTFHVHPSEEAPPAVAGEAISRKVDELVIHAVEDASLGELPHPRSRLHVELGPKFFSSTFTQPQQRALEIAQRGGNLGALLDAMPETDGAVLEDLRQLEAAGVLTIEEPEARFYVVTDSSADLPVALARSHGIAVVPMSVSFGKERFHDGVDLRPKQFYDMLQSRAEHPVTSPPETADFQGRYRDLLPRRDVVSVHLSEKMSQTVVHARRAADESLATTPKRQGEKPTPELDVVDSHVVSLGLGLLALFAARMAARDLGAAEVARRLREIRQRVGILFVVDTLEYLRRGGRIGAARAMMGKLLGIKPILGVSGGEVVPVDRVRGGRAAHPRILELMSEQVDPERPLVLGVAHAQAPVWADRLRKLVEERFEVAELVVAEMGPTVGAHAGPGTVGLAWVQLSDEELALVQPPDA
jgi:DegV family protein with EDD domain